MQKELIASDARPCAVSWVVYGEAVPPESLKNGYTLIDKGEAFTRQDMAAAMAAGGMSDLAGYKAADRFLKAEKLLGTVRYTSGSWVAVPRVAALPDYLSNPPLELPGGGTVPGVIVSGVYSFMAGASSYTPSELSRVVRAWLPRAGLRGEALSRWVSDAMQKRALEAGALKRLCNSHWRALPVGGKGGRE